MFDLLAPRRPLPPALGAAAAFFAPVLLCLALTPLRTWIVNTAVALLLVVVIAVVAWTGGRRGGYLAVVAAALAFDFFWTVPLQSFAITDGDHLETALVLATVGVVVVELVMFGRRQQGLAGRRAGYLEGVLDAAAPGDDDSVARADLVAARIAGLLGVERCRFVDRMPDDLPVLDVDGVIRWQGRPVDTTDRLPVLTEVVLPVRRGDRVVGAFVTSAATAYARPDRERRRVAAAIAERSDGLVRPGGRGGAATGG